MADLISHSLTFSKEDVRQLFVEPAFMGDDVIKSMDILTDVKGVQNLNFLSLPSNITRDGSSLGFNGVTGAQLTQKTLEVVPVKAEWEDNAKVFVRTVFESLIAQGVSQDDIEAMSTPNFYRKYVLPEMAKRVGKDYQEAIWFGDTRLKALSGTAPNAYPSTGTTGVEYLTLYNGLWRRIWDAINDGDISSDQIVRVTNSATKGKYKATLTATGGTITITVNGVAYTEAYDTDAATTVSNWVASHKATIEALYNEEQKVVVSNSGATLTLEAKHEGGDLDVTFAASSGSWSVTETDATAQAALSTGDADAYFDSMLSALHPDAYDYEDEMVFYVSNSMYRNYLNTLKSTSGVEGAFRLKQNGQKVLQYEGHDVIPVRQWDNIVNSKLNGVYKHRAILTHPKNFVIGTDGASDMDAVDTWFNKDKQMRRFRVQYKAGTAIKHNTLIVVAY